MTHQIRASMMVGGTLLLLFFASWVLTSVLAGNPIKVEFYDTLESELAGQEYSGVQSAFAVGMLLEVLIGCNILIVPLMGWSRYTKGFFVLSALALLAIGIGVGTRPYTFHFGIVEKDAYNKPPIPLRGLVVYGGIVVGGIFSFIFLWLDNKNKSAPVKAPVEASIEESNTQVLHSEIP